VLGSAVHADCHSYDDNDLNWGTVDVRVLPYVEAWAQVREDRGLVPLTGTREQRVYHPVYHYTGIIDGVFSLASDTTARILLDIKTGNPDDAAAHLQTAAYAEAWASMHPEECITARWAVWLRPDRSVPYSIVDYSARPDAYADFQRFLACLTVYTEQPARRRMR
jgi:hypothetical protein